MRGGVKNTNAVFNISVKEIVTVDAYKITFETKVASTTFYNIRHNEQGEAYVDNQMSVDTGIFLKATYDDTSIIGGSGDIATAGTCKWVRETNASFTDFKVQFYVFRDITMMGNTIGILVYTVYNYPFQDFLVREYYWDSERNYYSRKMLGIKCVFIPALKVSPSSHILGASEYGTYSDTKEIIITRMPDKLSYQKGESISYKGLQVKGVFYDGTVEDITWDCKITPVGGSYFETDTTVTVKYQAKGYGYDPTIDSAYALIKLGEERQCTFILEEAK